MAQSTPFAEALRAAIVARGLTLDRLAHRLLLRGHPVSVASLSYWSRGLRVPERPESIEALGVLEEALRLPPGALRTLLAPAAPARRRTRRTSAPLPVDQLWGSDEEPVSRVLAAVGTPYEGRRTVSLHDRYRLDEAGREVACRITAVIEATMDDVDRILVIYGDDTGGRRTPTLRVVGGARPGRCRRDRGAGVSVWELWLDRILDTGERSVVEYELDLGTGSGAAPTDSCVRRFANPVRQYVLEVAFTAEFQPAACTAVDGSPVALAATGVARLIVLDGPAGTYGLTWEWPDRSQ